MRLRAKLIIFNLSTTLPVPGLYIHIPFCAQKCGYCDFYSGTASPAGELCAALKREMECRRDFLPERKLDTLYIGGGTPTLLAPEELGSLLGAAAEFWDCGELRETTVEANPEDLTDDYLERLAAEGFNRLSIGIQSFDDSLLRTMNRRHSAQRAREAVRSSQKAGFGNITIDLIYGIPGMSHAQWERSLDAAVEMGVQHISAYHLTIEPDTTFGLMARRGAIAPVAEAESEKQYETLRRRLGDAGFEHYEISNFARKGFRAIHNSAYWSGRAYLGIGPSAHSYDGQHTRSHVIADTALYLKYAGSGAVYETEKLSQTELLNEFIMTSLRTAEGIDITETEKRFGRPAAESLAERAEVFVANGKVRKKDGRIFIPPENFLVSDYVISTLFASEQDCHADSAGVPAARENASGDDVENSF